MSAWTDFVKQHMAAEMKRAGGDHGKAMKAISAKWKAKKPAAKGHRGHSGKSGPHKGHKRK